jgi:hypothetical protein
MTQVHMPLAGSPLIDNGDPGGCTDNTGTTLSTDQRGAPRPVDGDASGGARCDIGAVEYGSNPVPVITSLDPTSGQVGGGSFTLTVNGSDFLDGAVVQWDGSARPTTVISETRVSAQITAADMLNPAVVAITVLNPAPGGGVSNPLAFNITAPASQQKIYLPLVLNNH